MIETNVAFSPSDIRNKLQTDRNFAAGFAIDNNYPAIKANLEANGFVITSEMDAYNALLTLGQTSPTALMKVLNVPYNSAAGNYTAGYEDFFIQKSPAPSRTGLRSFNWSGLLSVVGGVIAGAGAILAQQNGTGTTVVPPTPAEIAAADAAAKAKKKKMWTWIIVGSIAAIVLVVVIYKVRTKKK
jgi:hypothetical protein